MATTHPLTPSPTEAGNAQTPAPAHVAGKPPGAVAVAEQALVTAAHPLDADASIPLAGPVARLPVELEVSVPVRDFRVRNLLNLELSQLVESGWGHDEDVPLSAGQVQLAWSEFEVVDTQLAVRVTRLA